eukprot:Colp12_sorted_trinity150504_noHs@16353
MEQDLAAQQIETPKLKPEVPSPKVQDDREVELEVQPSEGDIVVPRAATPVPKAAVWEQLRERKKKLKSRRQRGSGTGTRPCGVCLCIPDDAIEDMCCTYCRACLASLIDHAISEKKVKITCPGLCGGKVIRPELIRELASPERLAKYELLVCLRDDPNATQCPLCEHMMKKEEVVFSTKPKNECVCSNCKYTFCFYCRAPPHEKLSCKQYRRGNKALRSWLKKTGAKRCPGCKTPVERTTGCDHMSCRCGTAFCYRSDSRILRVPIATCVNALHGFNSIWYTENMYSNVHT